MPTATQETEQTTEMVTFTSKSVNQVLTRRPPRNETNEFGQKTVVTEEEWFDRMRQRKEDTGEDFDDTPWRVEFVNHEFQTDHPKLLRWLRQHDKLGVNAPSGFWESAPTEEQLRPTTAEQHKAIARATASDDFPIDQLIAIREGEKNTHNRPAIVGAADAAIEALTEEPSESEAAAGSKEDPPSTSQP